MLNLDAAYREHARMVYGFLKSLCYDDETAEELTQETFYQAVRCANKYDGTCKVSTWLCQIAKHLWYREQERKKKKGTEMLDENLLSDKKLPDEEGVSGRKKWSYSERYTFWMKRPKRSCFLG